MKNKMWTILIVSLIGLTLIWLGSKMYYNPTFRRWVTSPAYADRISREQLEELEARKNNPHEKWITLNDREWQGISCFDSSKQIVGEMLTRGVRWQVRLDRDDKLIFPVNPVGGSGQPNVKLPDANINEWRIMPGETTKEATMVARLLPRDAVR